MINIIGKIISSHRLTKVVDGEVVETDEIYFNSSDELIQLLKYACQAQKSICADNWDCENLIEADVYATPKPKFIEDGEGIDIRTDEINAHYKAHSEMLQERMDEIEELIFRNYDQDKDDILSDIQGIIDGE